GSADGAFMLVALNRQFHLGLDNSRLEAYAAQLGSDCPFFIQNTPALGGGRGERLEPIAVGLSGYSFLVIRPPIPISTAKAFAGCTPDATGTPVRTIIQQPVATWRHELINDFESPLFGEFPALGELKQQLYDKGAVFASLTGSGSSLFGIFEKGKAP